MEFYMDVSSANLTQARGFLFTAVGNATVTIA
jgi:hypothetical protein